MERRDLVKVLGISAALPVLAGCERPNNETPAPAIRGPAGTAADPDLLRPKVGWEKVLSAPELATLSALCDLIIPADEKSPSASQVGVPDFVNEWASAPYEYQRSALVRLRGGLAWLDTEAAKRFGEPFGPLTDDQKSRIADDICHAPRARPEFQAAAQFFDFVRDLTATGFYTTTEGMKDLQYIGNVALPRYDGPPAEVPKHLGLTS